MRYSLLVWLLVLALALPHTTGRSESKPTPGRASFQRSRCVSASSAVPNAVDELDIWPERKAPGGGRADLLNVMDDMIERGIPYITMADILFPQSDDESATVG